MTSLTPPGLAGQMYTLVREDAFLWEVGGAVTEYLGGGRTFVQGPWPLERCRRVLLCWLEAGWLDCIAAAESHVVGQPDQVVPFTYDAEWRQRARLVGTFFVLDRDDARALLADPSLWRVDGPGAGVSLSRANGTDGLTYDDWISAVADIAGGDDDA